MSRRFEVSRGFYIEPCDFCSNRRRCFQLWPTVTDHYVRRNLAAIGPVRMCLRCGWKAFSAMFAPGKD